MKKEVVHVPTRELAEEVLRVAQENGLMETIDIKDWRHYKTETHFKPDENGCFYKLSFVKINDYKIITAEEFLNRYKPKFRPIAMKCTQEQFEAVKDKLVNYTKIGDFNIGNYLVNNLKGYTGLISNINGLSKADYGRQVFEEYCEKTLLECCGIDVKDEANELDQLRKENEELKQQLKELQDQPKVGDVCLFWDNGVNEYTLGLLREHSDDSYWSNNSYYHNCILYTDENLKKVIEQIKLNNK